MNNFLWAGTFRALFDRCVAAYRGGDADFDGYYGDGDRGFLRAIGYKPREFFDFVEDFADEGEPDPETAVLVAAVRRDYLGTIMNGELSGHAITPEDLPDKEAALAGVAWLPRIIVKAQAKLRGELDPDIMFSCGGDRAFLREHDIHPADFLRMVWAADHGRDTERILAFVRKS